MQETVVKQRMTRGTKNLITEAIETLQKESPEKQNNRNDICFKMVELLDHKFDGKNFDYQARRMNLETTGQILHWIEEYFERYPNRQRSLPEDEKLEV
ncbi:hypothetical protein [Rossellomorea marisflavi]|uniref:hypothetical protein n=1 Tax=Rossellomorea marisflavi TaxID=189381 RepID=UPI003F9F09B7